MELFLRDVLTDIFWNMTALGIAALFALPLLAWQITSRIGKKPTKKKPATYINPWHARFLSFWRRWYVPAMIAAGALALLWALTHYIAQIPGLLGQVLTQLGGQIEGGDTDGIRNLAYAFAALAGALTLMATIPFQLIKIWMNERAARTAEEGHITDRINAAVQALGTEKAVNRRGRTLSYAADGQTHSAWEWEDDRFPCPDGATDIAPDIWQGLSRTEPNLEVRIGAIYALERIAQDSDRDHVQVMEILCAYIRENAPAKLAVKPEDHGIEPLPDLPEDADAAQRDARLGQVKEHASEIRDWAYSVPAPPRTDIQTALTVLGRRDPRQIARERAAPRQPYRLDLRNACLQRADLHALDLSKARFDGSHLEGADLYEARMEGAHLFRARMEGANLSWARMEGANLSWARMEGADLSGARMEGTNLNRARMEGAVLSGARMEGANLSRARMEGANLIEARMEGAVLRGARMEGADLSGARMEGADLFRARMEGADLTGARMEGANLSRARMEGADLTGARFSEITSFQPATLRGAGWKEVDLSMLALTADHLKSTFGDATVTLPDGMTAPAHWPDTDLYWDDFFDEWRRWRDSPDTYRPPQDR